MKTTITLIVSFLLLSSVSLAQVSYVIPNSHKHHSHSVAAHHVHNQNCFQKQYQEWIPGGYAKQFIPAKYKTIQVHDAYLCRYVRKQVLIRPAKYKNVFIPGHYVSKTKWICKPIYQTKPVLKKDYCYPKYPSKHATFQAKYRPHSYGRVSSKFYKRGYRKNKFGKSVFDISVNFN